MLGLSRWTEKGGSYRTIQRFYHTVLSWPALHWLFFKESFLHSEDEYIAAGDEVVVSKAGKETLWTGSFFCRASAACHSGSLILCVFPGQYSRRTVISNAVVAQIVKSCRRKATSKAKAAAKKGAEDREEKKSGRPKGSKNKDKEEVVFTPELLRIKRVSAQPVGDDKRPDQPEIRCPGWTFR